MNIAITLTSSLNVGEQYIDLTRRVAAKIAQSNHGIVYGGTAYGMMLELAKSYKEAGGNNLIGVMAEDLVAVTKGYEAYPNLDETYIVPTMSERKDKIFDTADGIIILPGGWGTFEEFVTMAGSKVNKLSDKPIAILNQDGFYDTLIKFFDELQEKEFTKIAFQDVVYVSDDIDDILSYLASYKAIELEDKFV